MTARNEAKRQEISDYLNDFLEEFNKETDRAAAVLAASLLDEHLRKLLAAFLIDDESETKELLEVEKPLGNFGARIRAAYCLGLISPDEYHDLKLIQRIRNQFAHRLLRISFESVQIRDRCLSLEIPQKLVIRPLRQDLQIDSIKPRD